MSGDSEEAGVDTLGSLLTPEVTSVLRKLLPAGGGVTTLYRGLHWPSLDDYLSDRYVLSKEVPRVGGGFTYLGRQCSSWTLDLEVAKEFSWNGDAIGVVLEAHLDPDSILIDVRLLQGNSDMVRLIPEDRRKTLLSEAECIVLPGTYQTQIVYLYDQKCEIGPSSTHGLD